MPAVRIDLDGGGIRELLASDDVRAMLESKAEAVANAARARGVMVDGSPGNTPLPIVVDAERGRARARAAVIIDHPSGMAVEAKHRLLVGSLDAAR